MRNSNASQWLFSCLGATTLSLAAEAQTTYCQDAYHRTWYACGANYSTTSVSGNSGPTWANGLPQYVDDETVYYLYDPEADKFSRATTTVPAERLYVHFKFDRKRWVWASGADWRSITPGSKLQGKRVGYATGSALALDWYRLDEDWLTWKRVTDRVQPVVYRWDPWAEKPVVGETYPTNWVQLGGTLDPLPTGKPTCKLTLSAKSVKANQPLVVRISIQGDATDVEIEGQRPPITRPPHADAYALYTLNPPSPGFYTASAKVTGPGGEGTCEIPYGVDPADSVTESLSCQVTLDREAVAPGESVVATLRSKGGNISAVEIAGSPIFNFIIDDKGNVTVQRRVEIRRQSVDSRTGKVSISGKVRRGDRDVECAGSVSLL